MIPETDLLSFSQPSTEGSGVMVDVPLPSAGPHDGEHADVEAAAASGSAGWSGAASTGGWAAAASTVPRGDELDASGGFATGVVPSARALDMTQDLIQMSDAPEESPGEWSLGVDAASQPAAPVDAANLYATDPFLEPAADPLATSLDASTGSKGEGGPLLHTAVEPPAPPMSPSASASGPGSAAVPAGVGSAQALSSGVGSGHGRSSFDSSGGGAPRGGAANLGRHSASNTGGGGGGLSRGSVETGSAAANDEWEVLSEGYASLTGPAPASGQVQALLRRILSGAVHTSLCIV